MTKLYMKQKVFSLCDRFTVKDENEQDRYYVEGEIFTIGKKLHICDMAGSEVAFVQQKVLTLLPRFYVYVDGAQVAEIVKEFTFLRPCYRIDGPGWRVNGDFWAHDYEIVDMSGRPIVAVHKVWLAWGDSYELDVARREDEVQALATVLAIDCVLDAASAAASSSN